MNLTEQLKNFFKRQARTKFGEKNFFRGELEDMYMSLKNKVEFPALALEGMSSEYIRKENGWWRQITVAYCVFDSYEETGDYDAIDSVMIQTDKDAAKILGELIDEYQVYSTEDNRYNGDCDETGDSLGTANYIGAETVEVVNSEQDYAGVRCTITVECWWHE